MPFLGNVLRTLSHNPSIQRYPQSQKEWNGYLKEFEKYLAGEVGAFVPTFGAGFSSDPSNVEVYWKKIGSLVMMSFFSSGVGTSDANTFSITLPDNLKIQATAVQFQCPITGLVDNGAESWGTALISGSVLQFGYESASTTSWTTSGNKGWETSSATQPTIIYDIKFPSVET